MPFSPLRYKRRELSLHKCSREPDFTSPTVLVENQWDYIEMWLKRNDMDEALFFWNQAESFYEASKALPKTSSPLTSYYSAMNATKALLHCKGLVVAPRHGMSGERTSTKTALNTETTELTGGGVIAGLCNYMGEPHVQSTTYTLKDLLYNLPYVHRAYTVTFTSAQPLFFPIENPLFVRNDGTAESYFCFVIKDNKWQHHRIISSLQQCERNIAVTDRYLIRRTNRFNWDDSHTDQVNYDRFLNYYRRIRLSTYYIKGFRRLWYVKRSGATRGRIERSSLTLTLMALHRLSEIARYSPDSLARHFDSQHNWLLSEFINLALDQFIDEIAAEMTGQELMLGGVR